MWLGGVIASKLDCFGVNLGSRSLSLVKMGIVFGIRYSKILNVFET